ncbi:hypothetical protein BGW80DRAFT_1252306 [Lactifluus volemus]|nr:hypothetical protein BGW80DRAFT_1252306 [Lactifluus volemus]
MIEIDWDTDDDRLRRRHKASTIHGWLCMWRGTLMGNEDIRQRGRREMREARAMRAYYRERSQAKASSRGPFSFFRLGNLVSIAIENPHYNATSPVVINTIAALVGLSITDLQRPPSVGVAAAQKTDITRAGTRRRHRSRRGITVHTLTRPDQATLDDPRGGVDWYIVGVTKSVNALVRDHICR